MDPMMTGLLSCSLSSSQSIVSAHQQRAGHQSDALDGASAGGHVFPCNGLLGQFQQGAGLG